MVKEKVRQSKNSDKDRRISGVKVKWTKKMKLSQEKKNIVQQNKGDVTYERKWNNMVWYVM